MATEFVHGAARQYSSSRSRPLITPRGCPVRRAASWSRSRMGGAQFARRHAELAAEGAVKGGEVGNPQPNAISVTSLANLPLSSVALNRRIKAEAIPCERCKASACMAFSS
jgi:hypothetical protein